MKLIDYRQIPVSPAVLSSLFSKLAALSLPVVPNCDGVAGLDGEIWQLTLFGDMCAEGRFQWWSAPPPLWQPLADLATEMRDAFAVAERRV